MVKYHISNPEAIKKYVLSVGGNWARVKHILETEGLSVKQAIVKSKEKIVVKRPIRPPEWESMSKIEQRDYNRFMKEKEERDLKMTWAEHLAAIGRSIKIAESTKENAARIAAKVKKQLEEAAAKPKKVFSTPEMRVKKEKIIPKIDAVVKIIKEKVSVVVVQKDTFPLKTVIVGMVGIGAAALYFMRRKKR